MVPHRGADRCTLADPSGQNPNEPSNDRLPVMWGPHSTRTLDRPPSLTLIEPCSRQLTSPAKCDLERAIKWNLKADDSGTDCRKCRQPPEARSCGLGGEGLGLQT